MTSPQPESELARLEAKIKAWFISVEEKLGIIHEAVKAPDAAPLPAPPTSAPAEPPAPIITPVTPTEAVALCLAASAGSGGYRTGLSWNQNAYLKTMDVKELAGWLAGVAACPECTAPVGTAGDSAGWLTGLSQAGQGIVLAIVQGLGSTILDTTVDPRGAV